MRERNRYRPEQTADSIARVLASWQVNRPDLNVEPIAITARLARLRQQLGARLESVFTAHNLTGGNFAVLATISRLGGQPLTQTQLMQELNLTAGTISVRINRLVRDRLVIRDPDPSDGRGWLIGLTPSGQAAFESCAPEHLANARHLTSGLTKDERDQLADLLAKLLHSLE
ncbi:MAG: MarR family winged helix-turn-helix transcriptional regulator [Trebonia sp.]